MQQDVGSPEITDRYKASSFRAYNFKLPRRYDTSMAARLCRVRMMDEFVLDELGGEVSSLAIVDIGCATGRLLDRLAANGAQRLAGLDLAPRILEVARAKLARRGAKVELRYGDTETSLPWPSRTFDVVTLTGVLHHFFRPYAALAEIWRVLRPAGRLIVVDACFFSPLREFFNLCLRLHPHEGDYHFYTPQQTRRMLLEIGWKVVRCERLSWCFYGIVAEREKCAA